MSELTSYDSIKVSWKAAGRIQMELNDGLNNLRELNLGIALQNFSEVLALDSTMAVAYYYRGVTYKKAGQFLKARIDLRRSQPRDSSFFEGFLELGKTYQLAGKFDQARDCFLKAKAIQPTSPTPLYRLGTLSVWENKADKTKYFFQECMKLDPIFFRAKAKLALLDWQGDLKNSVLKLSEIIEKDPMNKEALRYRCLLNQESDMAAALLDANKLVELSPTDIGLKVMRGLMLVHQKEYSLAFNDFKRVLQAATINQDVFRGHQSSVDIAVDLQFLGYYLIAHMQSLPDGDIEEMKKAYCLLFVGDYQGAVNIVKNIKNFEGSASCLFLLGIAQEYRNMHSLALNCYAHAIKLDPQIWEAHKKIGIYNTSVGKWKEAENEFSFAISRNPDFNSLYKLRGVARFFIRDYDGSIKDFTRYLKVDSLDGETLKNRAHAFLNRGRTDEALADFSKAFKAPNSDFTLGDVEKTVTLMTKKGDTLSAINLFSQFFMKTHNRSANDLKFVLLFEYSNLQLLTLHVQEFEKFVVEHPAVYEDKDTYIIKAVSFSRLGNFQSAQTYFDKAINLYPNNGWIYYYRGQMFLKMENTKEAMRDLKKSRQLGVDKATAYLKKLKK